MTLFVACAVFVVDMTLIFQQILQVQYGAVLLRPITLRSALVCFGL